MRDLSVAADFPLRILSMLMSQLTRMRRLALLAALVLPLHLLPARAEPITYTAVTVTDGKLGSWSFHNARVYLTLLSDTTQAQQLSPYPGTDVVVALNTYGDAYVTIVTASKKVRAKFNPGQIFVALDQGDLEDQPYTGGRGVGFGSFPPGGGFEPAYPLGIEDGTIDWGDAFDDNNNPSWALFDLSVDLAGPTAFSGRAWVCLGFPDWSCPTPGYALKTNLGDLYLYQPYQCCGNGDVLSGGLFTAQLGRHLDQTEIPPPRTTVSGSRHGRPITYAGALVSDVQVGTSYFANALVYVRFDANTSTAQPYTDGLSTGTVNKVGNATFKVIAGNQTVTGTFTPGEVYAFMDRANISVGFGSQQGGRGYPFALTNNEDFDGLVEESLMTALSDFFNTPGSASDYSPETATLVRWSGTPPGTGAASYTLTTPTFLSGGVSSCPGLDPVSSSCNSNPVALSTSAGDFILYQDFTAGFDNHTINWGLFWAEYTPTDD